MYEEGVLHEHDGRTIRFARGEIAESKEGISMFLSANFRHRARQEPMSGPKGFGNRAANGLDVGSLDLRVLGKIGNQQNKLVAGMCG
jgi:hypothetical protein